MLLNLHKKDWTEGLKLQDWSEMKRDNEESIKVRPAFPPSPRSCSSWGPLFPSLPPS